MPRARLARSGRRLALALWPLVALQAVTAGFFVWDIVFGVLGLRDRPINWQLREMIEVGAALGLVLGVAMGAIALRGALMRSRRMEEKLHHASSAFADLLNERFAEWALTPAEREVALFSIKGLSLADIARLRETSEGTVKSQSNAIYRKAGVSGRAQLVSLFLEDLMDDARFDRASAVPHQQAAQLR